MTHYLGTALWAQKLKRNQWRKYLLELLFSFLAGLGFGLCSGVEYIVKFFN